MKYNYLVYGSIGILLISIVGYLSLQYRNTRIPSSSQQITTSGVNKTNCLADDCLSVDNLEYPTGNLSDNAKRALFDAIDDEYHALSFYELVISKFGMLRPFSMIKGAEEQHIASLKALFDKYGLPVPVNSWKAKLSAPETLQQACQVGVDAEIANANLYRDTLLPAVAEYEDITAVFGRLMNASLEKHLPAFEKCN